MPQDKDITKDGDRQRAAGEGARTPAAGPHAKPELTNPDATPGTGSLPDEENGRDADGGVG